MFSFTEQFSATTDSAKSQLAKQLNIANEFASTAFDGVQQIIALNVSAAKASVEKSSTAAKQLFEVKDPGEFFKFNTARAPNFDNILAYSQELYNIAAKTQTDLLAVVNEQINEQIKDVTAAGAAVAAKPLALAAKVATPPAAAASVAPAPAAPAPVATPPAPAAAPVAAAPVAAAPAPVSVAVPAAPAAAPVTPAATAAAPAAPAVKAPEAKPIAAAVAEAVQPEQKNGKGKQSSVKAPAAEAVVLKSVKAQK